MSHLVKLPKGLGPGPGRCCLILPQVLVRVPCWHRQRMLPCIPKFKAVSCCGRRFTVSGNADFRFTGESHELPCHAQGVRGPLCGALCEGHLGRESLEKIKSNQTDLLQSTLPTYLTLEKSPPSFQSRSRAMILIFFCLKPVLDSSTHRSSQGQLLQKCRLS